MPIKHIILCYIRTTLSIERGAGMQITTSVFKNFNIACFSKDYVKPAIVGKCYQQYLNESGKRTRSDFTISCHNMIMFILLWVLNPEYGYTSVLNNAKALLLKCSKNIENIMASITDAGLCKARKRFPSIILKNIWRLHVVGTYYKQKGKKLWKGLYVCAIDGTSFTLKKTLNILKFFPLKNSAFPKLAACLLYDVYARIPLDIEFGPMPNDERGLLNTLIAHIVKNTLLLLDRGFPSYWLFYRLLKLKIEFVIRVSTLFHYEVVKQIGYNDWIIEIFPSTEQSTYKKYLTPEEYAHLPSKIQLRLIKTQMKGFLPRFIVTSLDDVREYGYKDIAKLYCDRWIIEGYYKNLKHILLVEKFHAEFVDGVYQEIYAALILTVILYHYILKASNDYNIPFLDISFIRALRVLSLYIFWFEMLSDNHTAIEKFMVRLLSYNHQKQRPGRSFKRVFYRKIKSKKNKWE